MKQIMILSLLLFSLQVLAQSQAVVSLKNPFLGSRFYSQQDNQKNTSVILLHGSEGGSAPYIDSEAKALAALGYRALSYCYFDCNRGSEKPMQTLKNVELTRLQSAIRWLRTLPGSNGRVVLYGFSRGAELTMILGSLQCDQSNCANALIAHAPSDVFNGPWNWLWRSPKCWLCKAGACKCPEDSPNSAYEWNRSCGTDDPSQVDFSISAWQFKGTTIKANQRIPIERFNGPILISVGDKDEVWPFEQTQRLEKTLRAAGKRPEIYYFSQQGHIFSSSAERLRRKIVLNFLKRVP